MSVEDQIAYFAEWTAWLDRGERFVTLRVFENPVSLRRPTGGGKEAKAWLHANNAKIKTFVRGMATVVPPECLAEVNRINAEKLFGVPAQTFDELEKAAEWIIKVFKEDEIYHIDRQIIVDHTLDLQLSRGGGCTVSR